MTVTWSAMLVDGDRLFCAALAALLKGGAFNVDAECGSLGEAVNQVRLGRRPDIILLSLHPANGSLAEDRSAIVLLRDRLPDCRIVALGADVGTETMTAALKAGVDGCLHKSMSCEALQQALHLVMLGEAVFPSDVADLLVGTALNETRDEAHAEPGGAELSKRELEILRCLLAGQSNKAIARNLSITESTVKMHFKNVMRKIRAQNRTQAAVWAIQHGLAPRLTA
ncbi:response regulator transcription factor [Arenibaculum sp.]|jgi:two-component system nitrate/nitrite response regulator NarL|uniref:response regulator transcription factor n=1 Tax=Arenibaculum sp. TaxID=2865862 RepID=UPI002E0FFA39|nr:response regulator transcription factor [Arenibaculum sp.]